MTFDKFYITKIKKKSLKSKHRKYFISTIFLKKKEKKNSIFEKYLKNKKLKKKKKITNTATRRFIEKIKKRKIA